MSKKNLEEINNMVWNNKWKGDIDPIALKERIIELLDTEKSYQEMCDDLAAVKKFIMR